MKEPLVPALRLGVGRFLERFALTGVGAKPTIRVDGLSVGNHDLAELTLSGEPFELVPRTVPPCVLLLRPTCQIELRSRDTRQCTLVTAGQTVALNATSRYLLVPDSAGKIAVVAVLHDTLAAFGARVPDDGAMPLRAEATMLGPCWAFFAELIRQKSSWQPIAAYCSENLIQEMCVAILLDSGQPGVPTDRGQELFTRARTHIVAYCHDPRISADAVAMSLGVSLRQLQRTFAIHDTTIGAEIRRQRALAAQAMLASHGDLLSRGEIAQACGYPTAEAMRRAVTRLSPDC